jgi:hypothetical protein
VKSFKGFRVIVRVWERPVVDELYSATSMYDSESVTVAGAVPRLVDDIVKVLIGIGVFVDEGVIAVITPAIYSLYLIEDSTVTVILFKAWDISKAFKFVNVKVVFPLTVILFLELGPKLLHTRGSAGSV